jgi:phosphorylcholine metabolism protein LicD
MSFNSVFLMSILIGNLFISFNQASHLQPSSVYHSKNSLSLQNLNEILKSESFIQLFCLEIMNSQQEINNFFKVLCLRKFQMLNSNDDASVTDIDTDADVEQKIYNNKRFLSLNFNGKQPVVNTNGHSSSNKAFKYGK